jgi:1-acyl-sn-glycerol-3-phosphate acyltransferase
MDWRRFFQRGWYELLKNSIYVGGVLFFRIRYWGRQNVPRQGPLLLVANHQSHLDPPLIGAGIPRPLNFLARQTLFDIPLLGRIIATVNAIPIDRQGVGLGGIKESLRRLKRGEGLMVFPEGTRSPDGEIQRFLPGFTALAVRTGAVIVPAAIEGAYDAWPRTQNFPGPADVDVCYGPPISTEEIKQYQERELLEEVERRVRACHAELVKQRTLQGRGKRIFGKTWSAGG